MKMHLFLVTALILCLCSLAHADQITIVSDVWCPYNCEPGSAAPGYMIEIAQQVFTKAGHTVKYQIVEWARAIEETRKGRYNATVGGFKSDTPDFVFPDKILGVSQQRFFVKKGSKWRYAGIASLRKIRLGVIDGYSYGTDLNAYIAENKGKPSIHLATGETPLKENVDLVMVGKIDAFIEDPSVFGYYFASKGLLDVIHLIEEAGPAGDKDDLYIAFSPANPKSKSFAATLSQGIGALRKSGELKKILTKYNMKDWE